MENNDVKILEELKSLVLLDSKGGLFDFCANILLSVKMVFNKEIPTAGANNTEIAFNPDFLAEQSKRESVGLVMHEVLHIVLNHQERVGSRDRKIWNYAADAIVNEMVTNGMGLTLPVNPVTFTQLTEDLGVDFTYLKEASTEDVYNKLMEHVKSSDIPEPVIGDLMEKAEDEPTEVKTFDLESKLISADIISKYSFGNEASNELERELLELVNPKVDWYKELIYLMREFVPSVEPDWSRPNRRLLGIPILIPGNTKQPTLEANCYIDVSGSLTADQLTTIMSELTGINSIEGVKLNVISWNTGITRPCISSRINT